MADVPHPEQHGGDERDDDRDHRAFQVYRVAHVDTMLGRLGGHEQEGFERVEGRVEFFKFPALGEMRLDGINESA